MTHIVIGQPAGDCTDSSQQPAGDKHVIPSRNSRRTFLSTKAHAMSFNVAIVRSPAPPSTVTVTASRTNPICIANVILPLTFTAAPASIAMVSAASRRKSPSTDRVFDEAATIQRRNSPSLRPDFHVRLARLFRRRFLRGGHVTAGVLSTRRLIGETRPAK